RRGSGRWRREYRALTGFAVPVTCEARGIYSPPFKRTGLSTYVQQNQPPDVPPLELTGERTLPDVPEENDWYLLHLAVSRWLATMLAPDGVAYISTPNRLTLAPPGAERSDNPWHVREYTAREYRALLESTFTQVELLGLFHARKLRLHELALKLGWDRVHPRLRLTRPFYDRFV